MSDADNVSEYYLENYDIVNINRTRKRGGGVMLYISKHFEYREINKLSFESNDLFEVVTVELEIKHGKNIVVSCMYRAPEGCLDQFNDKFSEFVNGLKIKTKSYVLCGDFNVNMINYKNHTNTRNFADILINAGMFPQINLPTRISAGNSTLIDNIFTNITYDSSNGVLINDTISDHLPIFTCIDYKGIVKVSTNEYKWSRDISRNNMQNFKEDLTNVDWNRVYECNNCNEAFNEFMYTVKSLFDKNCPVKKIKVKSRDDVPPWLTKSIIKSCRKKYKLYKNYIKYKTSSTENKYKRYRNRLTFVLMVL